MDARLRPGHWRRHRDVAARARPPNLMVQLNFYERDRTMSLSLALSVCMRAYSSVCKGEAKERVRYGSEGWKRAREEVTVQLPLLSLSLSVQAVRVTRECVPKFRCIAATATT